MSRALGPPISFAFLSLSFSSSCSIAFLKEVKCCSEHYTAKNPCRFYLKAKQKFYPRGQAECISIDMFELLVHFELVAFLCTLLKDVSVV